MDGAMNHAGRTALITGASSGIGEEFAKQFARRGAHLILVARRLDRLDRLRAELVEEHPEIRVEVLVADLAEPDSAAGLVARVGELGLDVDVLVNNAGVGAHGKVVDQDPAANAAQIQLNCVTLVELTGYLLPAMTKAHRGVVVNVASTSAFQPTPSMAVYGASKAFVLSFTEALWQEAKGTGVRVFALCPGATDTEFFDRTGERFMTRGRQTSEQVVDVALKAIDGSGPRVISGLRNTVLALSTRFVPRRLLISVSERIIKAT